MTLLVFLIVAITIGSLAGTVREQAEAAQARIKAMRALYDFASRLGATFRRDDLVHAVAIHANRVADHQAIVMLAQNGELVISHAWPPEDTLEPSGWAARAGAREHGEPAGFGTDTLPTAEWHFRPIRTKESIIGVVGIRRKEDERAASGEMLRTLTRCWTRRRSRSSASTMPRRRPRSRRSMPPTGCAARCCLRSRTTSARR